MSAPPRLLRYDGRATLVIIGMRGVGKTTLGIIASSALERRFIDADAAFEAMEQTTVSRYVDQHGWPAFRSRETMVLASLLSRHPQDAVIACGGGLVESVESRRLLINARRTMPVVLVLREKHEVTRYLVAQTSRPDYEEGLLDVMRRREPLFRECASHVFVSLTAASSSSSSPHPLALKHVERSFLRLIRSILIGGDEAIIPGGGSSRSSSPQMRPAASLSHLLGAHGPGPGPSPGPPDRRSPSVASATGATVGGDGSSRFAVFPRRADPTSRSSLLTRRTTFLSLTFADIGQVNPALLRRIVEGVDAIELRVDMLECLRPASRLARMRRRSQHHHADRGRSSTDDEDDELAQDESEGVKEDSRDKEAPQVDLTDVAIQVETLRRLAPELPLMFTCRSDREGGYFYDDRCLAQRDTTSAHSQALYFRLADLALAMQVELLDVELGWDPVLTRRLIDARGRTAIVASYHDLNGDLRWDSVVPAQLYDRARSFGQIHLVEIIGTASRRHIEQNAYLASFLARVLSTAAVDATRSLPPLTALNMGAAGRSSRLSNDVLGFVSHPALPSKAGPGQMSLRETVEMLASLGALEPRLFRLVGRPSSSSSVRRPAAAALAIERAFAEFGLPYTLALAQRIDEHDGDDGDGLFLSGWHTASMQRALLGQMTAAMTAAMSAATATTTAAAQAVCAVDVTARADAAARLLGTRAAKAVPNALGDCCLGDAVGDHTLPHALERLAERFSSPINAPGPSRSALVVVLGHDGDGAREIASRAALYAVARLGFGACYFHRMAHVSTQLNEGQAPDDSCCAWAHEVLDVAREERGQARPSAGCHVVELRNAYELARFSTSRRKSHFEPRQQQQQQSQQQLPEDGGSGTVSPYEAFKKPHVVLLVGGTDAAQRAALQSLSATATTGTADDSSVLPRDIWETHVGGTILRIPTEQDEGDEGDGYNQQPSEGARMKDEEGEEEEDDNDEGAAWEHEDREGTVLERAGWIHVSPQLLERERVQRGVVEPWTRMAAPAESLKAVWNGR
ncbi:SKI-domain-containing protein [Acaromyces ingoldii]|uniref:shikimate kinase n=1 Tax=Acaromyces ingoldii TaxID=215250 RepID=A0A316YLW5_9BASI|nr:SKI-domain-containing protein [Acaromyces ingoldii]PWN89794.1 SKI-domain-containing protein [Acaromyces ingoldii]